MQKSVLSIKTTEAFINIAVEIFDDSVILYIVTKISLVITMHMIIKEISQASTS